MNLILLTCSVLTAFLIIFSRSQLENSGINACDISIIIEHISGDNDRIFYGVSLDNCVKLQKALAIDDLTNYSNVNICFGT